MKSSKILFWVQLSLFTAIELIFCFTFLGSIPITLGIVATLAHIPAIIAALALGKKAGLFIGAVMGISSLIIWTYTPPNPAVAFAFTPFTPNGNILSLLICIVPRALFPVITALLFDVLKKRIRLIPAAAVSAVTGTIFHSVLVLSSIYFVFRNHPTVGGDYVNFIVAWGGLNALLEFVTAGIISAAVIVPLSKINKTGQAIQS